MSFKNNTAFRTATIAASFMLTLLIAAFATGCAAEGFQRRAKRCTRKLRHRPRSGRFIHHYRAGELHGRDFR